MVNYVNGTVIQFGGNVLYTCKSGYFFEEDYNKVGFNLTCITNGNFSVPIVWPKCLNPLGKFMLLIHNYISSVVLRIWALELGPLFDSGIRPF